MQRSQEESRNEAKLPLYQANCGSSGLGKFCHMAAAGCMSWSYVYASLNASGSQQRTSHSKFQASTYWASQKTGRPKVAAVLQKRCDMVGSMAVAKDRALVSCFKDGLPVREPQEGYRVKNNSQKCMLWTVQKDGNTRSIGGRKRYLWPILLYFSDSFSISLCRQQSVAPASGWTNWCASLRLETLGALGFTHGGFRSFTQVNTCPNMSSGGCPRHIFFHRMMMFLSRKPLTSPHSWHNPSCRQWDVRLAVHVYKPAARMTFLNQQSHVFFSVL